jgi:hypothetical protein
LLKLSFGAGVLEKYEYFFGGNLDYLSARMKILIVMSVNGGN